MFLARCVLFALAAQLVASADICGKPAIWPNTGYGCYPNKAVDAGEAVPHSWPWQVQLQVRNDSDLYEWRKGVCGGTIVSRYHILRAAHCFQYAKNPVRWRVLIGGHNTLKSSSDLNFAYVTHINIHDGYGRGLSNNIAIVTLKDPIQFGMSAKAVCLSSKDLYSGNKCFVTGWGGRMNYNFEAPSITDVLQQAEVDIFPFTVCQREHGGVLDKTMTCAYERKDGGVCMSDRGGPLVCQNKKGAWVLQGISSIRNYGCGNVTGIYTRVPYFIQWINKVIKN